MSFKILVFVKQVPDTQNISGDAMTPEGTVNRAALPTIFNPEDLNALELALQLKDRYDAEVVVATMGMPAAAEVLRQSLYRGADKAVLVTDRALAGADTLATSYTLSCCAKKNHKWIFKYWSKVNHCSYSYKNQKWKKLSFYTNFIH